MSQLTNERPNGKRTLKESLNLQARNRRRIFTYKELNEMFLPKKSMNQIIAEVVAEREKGGE